MNNDRPRPGIYSARPSGVDLSPHDLFSTLLHTPTCLVSLGSWSQAMVFQNIHFLSSSLGDEVMRRLH